MARRSKKNQFIDNFVKLKGNVSKACEATGISRQTYYNWILDKPFEELIRTAEETILDIAEEHLMELVEEKHFSAIKFLLESKGAKRGYGKDGISPSLEQKPVVLQFTVAHPDTIPDAFDEKDFL